MKKRFLLSIFLILIVPFLFGTFRNLGDFLDTAVNVNAGVTAVNGTAFTSNEIKVGVLGATGIGQIEITFTRAAGTASLVDFEFQVSIDGSTWSTEEYVTVSAATESDAVSNVVRCPEPINFSGISKIRLYRIINNDGANNITVCNASVSIDME